MGKVKSTMKVLKNISTKLPGNDSDWKSRVGWGLARQVGHPARLNLPTPTLYLQGQRESFFFPSVLPVAAAACLIDMRLRGCCRGYVDGGPSRESGQKRLRRGVVLVPTHKRGWLSMVGKNFAAKMCTSA